MCAVPVETRQGCCPMKQRSVSFCGRTAASSSSSSSLSSSLLPPGWSGPRVGGPHVWISSCHSNTLVTRQQVYCVMLHLTGLICYQVYSTPKHSEGFLTILWWMDVCIMYKFYKSSINEHVNMFFLNMGALIINRVWAHLRVGFVLSNTIWKQNRQKRK